MTSPLVKLSDVCNVTMGQAPKGSSYNEEGDGYALIAGAGDYGDITPEPKKFTTEPTRISEQGDIILCIRATIGDLNWSDKQYCLGRGVAGLRSKKDKLDQNYLWHFIQTNKDKLSAFGTGSTFKQISRRHIEDFEIPVPPLGEQKRIAAILDKADALRRKREKAIALTDDLLRSVFLDMFGDPVTNPKGWNKVEFRELISLTGGYAFKSSDYQDSGIPLVRIGNANKGEFDSTNLALLPEDFLEKYERYILYPNDMLITLTGTVGKDDYGNISRVSKEYPKWLLNQRVAKINVTSNKVTSVFVQFLLSHPRIKKEIIGVSRGVRQANIKNEDILSLQVPLPPMDIQKKFNNIKLAISSAHEKGASFCPTAESLFSSLTQQAFSRELTSQKEAA